MWKRDKCRDAINRVSTFVAWLGYCIYRVVSLLHLSRGLIITLSLGWVIAFIAWFNYYIIAWFRCYIYRVVWLLH
jgi:hypothetical protein